MNDIQIDDKTRFEVKGIPEIIRGIAGLTRIILGEYQGGLGYALPVRVYDGETALGSLSLDESLSDMFRGGYPEVAVDGLVFPESYISGISPETVNNISKLSCTGNPYTEVSAELQKRKSAEINEESKKKPVLETGLGFEESIRAFDGAAEGRIADTEDAEPNINQTFIYSFRVSITTTRAVRRET